MGIRGKRAKRKNHRANDKPDRKEMVRRPRSGADVVKWASQHAFRAIASVSAISITAIIALPLTPWGMAVLAILVASLCIIYWREASFFIAIGSLIALSAMLFFVNVLYLKSLDGTIYFFPCQKLSVDCLRLHRTETLGEATTVVPIPEIEFWFYKNWFSNRERVYFVEVMPYRHGYATLSPLEIQAASTISSYSKRPSQSPTFEMDFFPNVEGRSIEVFIAKRTIQIGAGADQYAEISLPSPVTYSNPGLFSSFSDGPMAAEDWRRAVFANELIRALFRYDSAYIHNALLDEAYRTGRNDDYLRYATFSIAIDSGRFGGNVEVSHRSYRLAKIIARLGQPDELSGLGPWGAAFKKVAWYEIRNMYDFEMENSDDIKLDPGVKLSWKLFPFRHSVEWLEKSGPNELERGLAFEADTFKRISSQPNISAAAVYLLYKQTVEGRLDVGLAEVMDKLAHLPLDKYKAIVNNILTKFPDERGALVHLMAKTVNTVGAGSWWDYISAVQAADPDGKDPLTEKSMDDGIREIRNELDTADARLAFLRSKSVNEYQNLMLSKRVGSSKYFDVVTQARKTCRTKFIECFSSLNSDLTGGVRYSEAFRSLVDADVSWLTSTTIDVLKKESYLGSGLEGEQIIFPAIFFGLQLPPKVGKPTKLKFTQTMSDNVCAAADTFSKNLLRFDDTANRITLHQMAVVLSKACSRRWGRFHDAVLARNEVGLDFWAKSMGDSLIGIGNQKPSVH